MAVSHQWLIQWSPPSTLFADISSQYKSVNENWKSLEPKWSEVLPLGIQSEGINQNEYSKQENKQRFEYEPTKRTQSDYHSRVAGLTLWLAMMGVATPQSIPADNDTPPFSTLYKWKHIDFEFPSEQFKQYAMETKKYIPENVLPLGIEISGSRIWVTFPSWRKGVPATLATVSREGGIASPLLKPYPDWTFHRAFNDANNCSGLISVFRVNADPCGKLWVLDSGQIESQTRPNQICPPSLVVFDLHTDNMIARYPIPKQYVLEDSLYSNIIVDTRTDDCSDMHVYLADTWRFGLLVFRESDAKYWRFSHPLFYPDPLASNYTLHGLNFQWADGIFGLALTPLKNFDERLLYFHSLSSYREFAVSTSVLRDPSRVDNSSTEFNLIGESRGLYGQASASAIDRRGVMFYGLVSRDSIGCWDTNKYYRKITLGEVVANSETLIYPNDIKIDQEEPQSVWVISNRLPMFQSGSLDPDDYNYRIMYADTTEAVRGTICDPAANILPSRSIIQRHRLP